MRSTDGAASILVTSGGHIREHLGGQIQVHVDIPPSDGHDASQTRELRRQRRNVIE